MFDAIQHLPQPAGTESDDEVCTMAVYRPEPGDVSALIGFRVTPRRSRVFTQIDGPRGRERETYSGLLMLSRCRALYYDLGHGETAYAF